MFFTVLYRHLGYITVVAISNAFLFKQVFCLKQNLLFLCVQVRLSTKQNPTFLSAFQSLSHAKCLDLANYYLGYNGWCTRIITVSNILKMKENDWIYEFWIFDGCLLCSQLCRSLLALSKTKNKCLALNSRDCFLLLR